MELINLHEGDSRLKISVTIQNNVGHREDLPCLIDTGCSTTMLDMDLAKLYGDKLEDSHIINIGNKQYMSQAYMLNCIFLGSLEIRDIFVLAVQFDMKDELRSGMLLGLNVLNNLEYCVNRNENVIRIKESIFANIPDNSYPYMHWFRGKSSEYVRFQGNAE